MNMVKFIYNSKNLGIIWKSNSKRKDTHTNTVGIEKWGVAIEIMTAKKYH
jgi:hypothetical protein